MTAFSGQIGMEGTAGTIPADCFGVPGSRVAASVRRHGGLS